MYFQADISCVQGADANQNDESCDFFSIVTRIGGIHRGRIFRCRLEPSSDPTLWIDALSCAIASLNESSCIKNFFLGVQVKFGRCGFEMTDEIFSVNCRSGPEK